MEINDITSEVLGAAVEVHRRVGPGLLESSYQECLAAELEKRDIQFQREVQIPLVYDGRQLETGYRLDFLVEDQVVVEVKAVQKLEPVFVAQTLTYMRVGGYPVGLLINFNVPYLGDGAIRRLVNRYEGLRPQEAG